MLHSLSHGFVYAFLIKHEASLNANTSQLKGSVFFSFLGLASTSCLLTHVQLFVFALVFVLELLILWNDITKTRELRVMFS